MLSQYIYLFVRCLHGIVLSDYHALVYETCRAWKWVKYLCVSCVYKLSAYLLPLPVWSFLPSRFSIRRFSVESGYSSHLRVKPLCFSHLTSSSIISDRERIDTPYYHVNSCSFRKHAGSINNTKCFPMGTDICSSSTKPIGPLSW